MNHAVKFAVVGAPAGPNVPENRCMDLPAGTGTTGRLAVGGYAMTSEYPAKTISPIARRATATGSPST